MKKVAINGFGRIGRLIYRLLQDDAEFEVVAINDLTDAEQLAYLLKYDTSHRSYMPNEISYENDFIIVKDKIKIFAEKIRLICLGMNWISILFLNVLAFSLVKKINGAY